MGPSVLKQGHALLFCTSPGEGLSASCLFKKHLHAAESKAVEHLAPCVRKWLSCVPSKWQEAAALCQGGHPEAGSSLDFSEESPFPTSPLAVTSWHPERALGFLRSGCGLVLWTVSSGPCWNQAPWSLKSWKSTFKFKEHRHSMVKVPVYQEPQMSTGLLVISTGKVAPPCCRLEAGMPRNQSPKAKLWLSRLLSWGAY